MQCPQCALWIPDAHTPACPRCGMSLEATAIATVRSGAEPARPARPARPAQEQPVGVVHALTAPPLPMPRATLPGGSFIPVVAPSSPRRAWRWRWPLYIAAGLALVLVLCSAASVIAFNVPTLRERLPLAADAATPTTVINFQDPLTQNLMGWTESWQCSFHDDGYHVIDGYLCFAPVPTIASGNVRVQAKLSQGDTTGYYGIVVRWASEGNYYLFLTNADGKWQFLKVIDHQVRVIAKPTSNDVIQRGTNTNNLLEVRMDGNHFDFYVDDVKVGQADDSTFIEGNCGVAGPADGEAIFTNFTVANSH